MFIRISTRSYSVLLVADAPLNENTAGRMQNDPEPGSGPNSDPPQPRRRAKSSQQLERLLRRLPPAATLDPVTAWQRIALSTVVSKPGRLARSAIRLKVTPAFALIGDRRRSTFRNYRAVCDARNCCYPCCSRRSCHRLEGSRDGTAASDCDLGRRLAHACGGPGAHCGYAGGSGASRPATQLDAGLGLGRTSDGQRRRSGNGAARGRSYRPRNLGRGSSRTVASVSRWPRSGAHARALDATGTRGSVIGDCRQRRCRRSSCDARVVVLLFGRGSCRRGHARYAPSVPDRV